MSSAPENGRPISQQAFDRALAEIDQQVAAGVLDCRATLERLGDDLELFGDLLGFYFRDAPKLFGEVELAVSAADAASVRHWAHRLKGLICNFDAHLAVQSAAEFEQMGISGQLERAGEVCQRLEGELANLTSQLRRF